MWFPKASFAIMLLIAAASWVYAEEGIAWEVHGNWRQNQAQKFLQKGDAVAPGAVLTAEPSDNATLLVLLPDGQRLFFDCHDARTCKQGFRIPRLLEAPDDDALALFASIESAMRESHGDLAPPPVAAAEVETIAPLQDDGTILLRQAITALPPGQYQIIVRSEAYPQISERQLAWKGQHDETRLLLPGAGLYSIQLFGSLGGERMRVTVLAEAPEHLSSKQRAFDEARKDLQEWNESFPGWPMHAWLQLFLRSLVQQNS